MTDEGFHEIQLNGKQLVFLFMAATVVAVVIFLCGVMVGRGVRGQAGDVIASAADVVSDPTAASQPSSSTIGSSPSDAPLSSQENLTYTERLEAPEPPPETMRDTPEPAVDPTRMLEAEPSRPEPARPEPARPEPVRPEPVRPEPARREPARPEAARPAPARAVPERTAPAVTTRADVAAALTEPAGNGFVVQVAAVTERGEADIIARRLGTKGYPAFVTTPAGAARVFRVRVGKYQQRREAEAVAARLEKEEQFKPWITR